MNITTGISQAFWWEAHTTEPYRAAEVAVGSADRAKVFWFDRLFDGSIQIPDSSQKPLTMLITGPPGSAKTTLALEFCFRLATENSQRASGAPNSAARRTFSSLYISLDAEFSSLEYKAAQLGFDSERQWLTKFSSSNPNDNFASSDTNKSMVSVWGLEQINERTTSGTHPVAYTIERLKNILVPKPAVNNRLDATSLRSDSIEGRGVYSPEIFVIDSINVLEPGLQDVSFEKLLELTPLSARIAIFIADTGNREERNRPWDFVCDTIVRLDYSILHDYYIRTIEIIKARHQNHVNGKHQLKIYSRAETPTAELGQRPASDYVQRLRRSHPWRAQGGVFIYPSIHYYLSVYKRVFPIIHPRAVKVLPDALNAIVQFPQGRCTAFIGPRGGHKSHLGYLNVLQAISRGDMALIISLRDDEAMTKDTLGKIVAQEFNLDPDTFFAEQDRKLEILYYHPGYITPEEFFHRMFINIHRLKAQNPGSNLTVLFNSLDQLSARFPLCAKQEIFVPGIIETLAGEGITGIFIAVNEPGQPVEQYGLLPMADLIISFQSHRFKFVDYFKHLNEVMRLENVEEPEYRARIDHVRMAAAETTKDVVVLQVVRQAGGHHAGDKGILELVETDAELKKSLYSRQGLHFTQSSSRYDPGWPV